jgi:alkanesulfonate monooxygenase SsuD/methylene tetrahydromethanopterin reductase-like flavin-dependent oxidoreductase (luciferase family)
MHVGMCLPFQGIGEDGRTDRDVYRNELRLGDLAEPLGFESLWGVEHHFTDYTMSPDPIQYLSYFAGRTKHIQLGTMVVVLPWHDPIRVAEEAALIDHLSDGRFVFGIGRGIGRVEFEGFRVEQNDSREMFVEYAQTVLEGLERGYCEFDGKFVQQPKRDIRPRPFKSFRGRTYAAAVSPESAQIMAKLGIGLLMIPQKPWPQVVEELDAYRTTYREVNGEEAPPPLMGGWICIDEDEARAREMAERYLGRYYHSVIDHYEFAGDHLQKMKGHETYAELQARMQSDEGVKKMTDFFIDLHPWGTPDQVYEKIVRISEMTGAEGFIGVFSSGGMPYDQAESGMRLFAEKVMPRLKKRIPLEKQRIAQAGNGPAADPSRFALAAAE